MPCASNRAIYGYQKESMRVSFYNFGIKILTGNQTLH